MNSAGVYFGEDIIIASCAPGIDVQALAEMMRASGRWLEVVPGMADLCVKYDPQQLTEDEAKRHFRAQFKATAPEVPMAAYEESFATDFSAPAAPDLEMASRQLGIDPAAFPLWITGRSYKVQMMGFQPGFAYLQDLDGSGLQRLPRLKTPRQMVRAGSIGLLGNHACIYALDGPGGWPIVGRVVEPMFRCDDAQPFRLSPGQVVRFAA